MSPPAPARRKFISLEIARFLAALCVAADHLSSSCARLHYGAPLPPMPSGMAVEFFFGLSGFVIYTAHAADAGRIGRIPHYLWRRFWRIFPLYWLSVASMFYFLWPHYSHAEMVKDFTLAPFTYNVMEMNPPAWSLRYEITFYLIFGLALLPYARLVVLPLWGVLLAWENYGTLLGLHPFTYYVALPAGVSQHLFGIHNIMFFAGLGAGYALRHARLSAWQLWPLLGLSGFVLLALLRADEWGVHYPSPAQEPFTAAAFGIVLFALASLEQGGHLRLPPSGAVLGAISYPLYILHAPVGYLFTVYFYYHPGLHLPLPGMVILLFLLGTSLLLAWLAWRWFDRPLQRLARRVA